MIETIITDDHALFRMGIRAALNSTGDIRIAGEAASGEELFALLETTTPDVILLDILLPDTSGVDIALRLKTERPEIKILAISAENGDQTVRSMVEIGIEGFISKANGGPDEIAHAIRAVASGEKYFGRDISDIIYKIYVARKGTGDVASEFTEQERRIIELCREGLSGKMIADRLSISPRTVDNHKNNIFRKLGINSTLEMVDYALKNGIIGMA